MLNPWYVTGFCDGEAAFTYSRNGGNFALYFGVKQREDNRQVIEEIREFFNFLGKIYYQKESKGSSKGGASQPALYYRVTKISELSSVIGHFDKYPLQSKKKLEAYSIWRKMVLYKAENYRGADNELLRSLAEKLSTLNLQGRVSGVHKK